MATFHKKQWELKWETYRRRIKKANQTPAQRTPINKLTLKIREGLQKAKSFLATHIRTERIGLKAYLHSRKVLEVESPKYGYEWTRQTAKHVLLFCPDYAEPRTRMLNAAIIQNYRQIVFTAREFKAAIRMIMETDLLEQFTLAKTLLYGKV